VELLIEEGKILAHDVARYLHIAELEDRLSTLRSRVPGPFARKLAKKPTKRAKRAVSAEVAATRKVQGQYIAHLTKFPKNQRGKFQKIAREESREKAIAAMKKSLAR
jgi:uncharacterized protein YceH (UPF0502 family)